MTLAKYLVDRFDPDTVSVLFGIAALLFIIAGVLAIVLMVVSLWMVLV